MILATALMTASCYLVTIWASRCFRDFAINDTVSKRLKGRWQNIIRPLGVVAVSLFMGSCFLHLLFDCFWYRRQAVLFITAEDIVPADGGDAPPASEEPVAAPPAKPQRRPCCWRCARDLHLVLRPRQRLSSPHHQQSPPQEQRLDYLLRRSSPKTAQQGVTRNSYSGAGSPTGTLVGKFTPAAPNDSQWLPTTSNDSLRPETHAVLGFQ